MNLYIAIGNVSKQFSKADNSDNFIYMLSAGADVAKHIAKFIYKNLCNMRKGGTGLRFCMSLLY